jgi:hypothetical protein
MGNFLKEVKTKKKQKKDSHFGISFNTPDVIYGNRGFENNPDLSKYLIKNQIELLKKSFK